MVTRRNTYYADPAIGAGVEALAEGIFGGGEREAQRARAGLLRQQEQGQRFENERFQRRAQNAEAVRELIRLGPPADPTARAEWNRQIYALRSEDDHNIQNVTPGFMRGLVYTQPLVPLAEREASFVGAGGNWGNTESGTRFSEAEATRRTGITAGATVQAARIREEGERYRFLHGDANPGADGLFLGPVRGRAMGLLPPVAPGSDQPLPPGVQGPVVPQQGPVFLPGSAVTGAGQTRTSPAPGPVQNGTPEMVTTQGNPTLQTEQGAAARTVRLREGTQEDQSAARSLLPIGVAEARGAVTLQTTAARIEAMSRRGGPGALRAAMVQRELDAALLNAPDEATRQRLIQDADARLSQIEADTGANSGAAQAAGIRADAAGGGAGNRTVSTQNRQALETGLTEALSGRGVRLNDEARAFVLRRAEEIFGERNGRAGGLPGRATELALTEFFENTDLPRTDWSWVPGSRQYGLPDRLRGLVPQGSPSPAATPSPASPVAPAAPPRALVPQGNVQPPARGALPAEGTIIRQGGRQYIIRGGVPVPMT